MNETDIEIENHGSIYLFRLKTDAAREWVRENVSEPNYFGVDALAVEHRYARELASGMNLDGLRIV